MTHKDIDTPSFKSLKENNSYVLIDVRTPEEYQESHLKGANNINFQNETFEDMLEDMDKKKKYLVYCRSGNRSRKTMFLMRDLGFEEVYNLAEGIISWDQHGYETEK